jgi:2-polyprenyl-3-methyl-5-hydroxy-6-metoxy-1,4-benzoquinol methylase
MNANQAGTPSAMHGFYGDIVHGHLVTDPESALQKYRMRIRRELSSQGIASGFLLGKVAIDIGSGFQAIILAEMGCKYVYHVDINQRQVEWLKAYCAKNKIHNIESECVDITVGIGAVPVFDIAMVYGVFHHLRDPAAFLARLLERSYPGSQILLRCYRSGSWSRWLVSYLRTLVSYVDVKSIANVFQSAFPVEENAQFLSDMLDDLFVPVWSCFSPRQFARDSRDLHMDFYCPDGDQEVCFGQGDENFRVRLGITDQTESPSDIGCLECASGIDQMVLAIPALTDCGFHQAWREFTATLETLECAEVALRIISLYRLSRNLNYVDYFRLAEAAPSRVDVDPLRDTRLQTLMDILYLWTKKTSNESGVSGAGALRAR